MMNVRKLLENYEGIQNILAVLVYLLSAFIHYSHEEVVFAGLYFAEFLLFLSIYFIQKASVLKKCRGVLATSALACSGFILRPDFTSRVILFLILFRIVRFHFANNISWIILMHIATCLWNASLRGISQPIVYVSFYKGMFWMFLLHRLFVGLKRFDFKRYVQFAHYTMDAKTMLEKVGEQEFDDKLD